MLGHQSGKLLLIASLALLTSGEAVNAQIFVRQPHHDKHVPEPWCGLQGCPAKAETFGFFRENWRRWPDESPDMMDALSPFVTPDRDVPDTIVPDARDEASQVQRQRTPVRSPGAGFTPPPETGLPDTSEPETGPIDPVPGNSNSDLPNGLGELEDGGAFPSGDLPADDVSDAFPSGDLPADDLDEPGLPIDDDENIFEPDANDPLNDLPGLNEGELEEYDLDLGLRGPRRNQAHATQPKAAAPRQIDLVSAQSLEDEVHVHIGTATNRRNPLRRLRARFATQRRPVTKPQPRQQRSTQSVAPASYSRPISKTAPASPAPVTVKSGARRANPLR